eukprot:2899450-Prymnesium_polylepis.1
MHDVTAAAVEQLARLTRLAGVVSPDLSTVRRISALAPRADAATDAAADDDAAAAAAASDASTSSDAHLLSVLEGCAAALRMPRTSVLAVRNGAEGSYLYSPEEAATFVRVPAVDGFRMWPI